MKTHSFSSATTHLRSPGKIFSCPHARFGQTFLPAQSEQSLQLGSCRSGEILAMRSCLWAARVLRAVRDGPISQMESTCSEQRAQHLRGRPDSCQMCQAACPRSTQLYANSLLSRKSQTYVVALMCLIFRLAGDPDTHRF